MVLWWLCDESSGCHQTASDEGLNIPCQPGLPWNGLPKNPFGNLPALELTLSVCPEPGGISGAPSSPQVVSGSSRAQKIREFSGAGLGTAPCPCLTPGRGCSQGWTLPPGCREISQELGGPCSTPSARPAAPSHPPDTNICVKIPQPCPCRAHTAQPEFSLALF